MALHFASSLSLFVFSFFIVQRLSRAFEYFPDHFRWALWVASILSLGLFVHISWNRKRQRLPPGPLAVPLLGNMLQLMRGELDEQLQKWRKQFGEIFTVWIGPIPLVMVCSLSEMKEVFIRKGDLFSNRWRNHVTDTFMGGDFGVVQIDGTKWREQRRFALHQMRNFGVGRPEMEDAILRETSELTDHLLKGRSAVGVSTPLAVCVGNVINKILFGTRFPQGSREMQSLHNLLDAQSELVIHPFMGLYIACPAATNIPLLNRPWQRLLRQRDSLWGYLDEMVEDHKAKFTEGVAPSDFTYAYLEELRRREKKGDDELGSFSEWQMRMLLLDLFFAGMETTVTTLKWAFLMMVLHEDVQEIQRIANILPINLLRTTSEDVTHGDFFFPSNTLVIPQISVLLYDASLWPEPRRFNPLRFLDEGGRLLRPPAFLPFSLGKRQCLGESLARAELFLIFTNVMKRLSLRCPSGQAVGPSAKRVLGLTVSPPAYSVDVTLRKTDDNHNCLANTG